MRLRNHPLIILIIWTFFSLWNCNKKSPDPELITVDLLRGDVLLCGSDQLGTVNPSFSCGNDTKKYFKLGLALLHSFEYDEAEKAFVKVIDINPDCVMAYWGIAMSNFHSLWMQSGTDYLEKGSKILEIANRLPKTEKEQEYLTAIGAFYNDWQTKDRITRIKLFESQMETLYTNNKGDTEATIFYALALCSAANPSDKTYEHQRKAGNILES